MSGPGVRSIVQKIILPNQTGANNFVLPANCLLREIVGFETAGHAVTGGLKFGTTSGATDIVAAQAVSASSSFFVTDATLLKRLFSATALQQIFFDAVAAWNSANVNITIIYENLSNG